MNGIFSRWRSSQSSRSDLSALLSNADPSASIRDRLSWLVEIFLWIRSPGQMTQPGVDFASGQAQAARVRMLLLTLSKNIEWKSQTAKTLRSIMRDTRSLDLFCLTGLPQEHGLIGEFTERILKRVLPNPPRENDLGEIFSQLFRTPKDALWLKRLDLPIQKDLEELLNFAVDPSDESWNRIDRDMEDAFLFLAGYVKTLSLAPALRKRIVHGRMRELPVFWLPEQANKFVEAREKKDLDLVSKRATEFRATMNACHLQLKEVYQHLDRYGVSVAIVYQLDRIEAFLKRLESLCSLLEGKRQSVEPLLDFLSDLVVENEERKTLGSLLTENFSLISRKIVERNAETGSHYIAKSKKEYWQIFRQAAGGGFITAFTAFLKIFLDQLPLSFF